MYDLPAFDPYADSRRLAAQQTAARVAGRCNCCTTIVGRPPGRRICWWRCSSGHVEGLCAACFDHWWANAREDPALAPISLQFETA